MAISGATTEQREGDPQRGREDVASRLDLAEFRAGVHVDDRAEEHAKLTDPVEPPRRKRGQRHAQVDHEERDGRHQSQGEQVERTVLFDATVDHRQVLPESRSHRVTEKVAGDRESHGCAERARKRHDDHTLDEAENGPRNQRQQGGAGERCAGHKDVDEKERDGGGPRVRHLVGDDGVPLRGEELEGKKPLEVEDEKEGNQRDQRQQ